MAPNNDCKFHNVPSSLLADKCNTNTTAPPVVEDEEEENRTTTTALDTQRNQTTTSTANQTDLHDHHPLSAPTTVTNSGHDTAPAHENTTTTVASATPSTFQPENDFLASRGHHRLPSKAGEAGETTTDAGLELLFAASLIQQKDDHVHSHNNEESLLPPKAISLASENDSAMGDASSSPLHSSADLLAAVGAEHQSLQNNDNVLQPSDRDVLCGRGGFINKHVGNIIYRKVVDYNKAIYKRVPKRHRILVSQSIVQTIEKHGGRFLQPLSGQGRKNQVWTCVQFRRAVQKTSQALREPPPSEVSSLTQETVASQEIAPAEEASGNH